MAKHAVELQPFTVPDRAVVNIQSDGPGLKQLPLIPLRELDAHTLDELVGDWLARVYAKVGMESPWERIRHD